MRRFELKLAGKNRKVPDPLRKIFGTGVLGGDPTRKIRARVDPKTGKPDIELKPSLKAGRFPKIIQKVHTDARLPPLKENELKRVVENLHHSTLEDPEVIHTIEPLAKL
jgi:hypothetical protein